MKDWDPMIYNTFSQVENLNDDYEMPMPIFITSN
jgi:hypothetical protein